MTPTPGIVITFPFPLGYSNGGTRSIKELSIQFGQKGIPVYIFPVSMQFRQLFPRKATETERQGFELDAQLAPFEAEIIRVDPNIFHPFLDGLKVRQALGKLLAKKPVMAVLSFFNEGIFLPGLLQKWNIPFNIFAIWQSYEVALKLPSKFRKPHQFLSAILKRQMIRNNYQQAECLFAISKHTGRELVNHVGVHPERIKTCYLGAPAEFSMVPRLKPDKINRFLFFGRITKSKGIVDAIQALGRLKTQGYSDWEFHINGHGYTDWAKKLISDAGLMQHIFLHKTSNDTDLCRFLGGGHLLLMPSHHESFGLCFAEAQAAGLPVIAYAVDSVPEVVANGKTGWLAPVGDIDQLTTLLVRAIENPEIAYEMGLAGRKRASQLFTWEKTAETILNELPFQNRYI